MDFAFIITIFLIGFIGSYISGMLGIGGSIIKYPMLLYIPPLFGLAVFSAHEVSGISAVQVFFATIGGVWAYRKGGYLNKTIIIYMGLAILIGSFVGGYGSKLMSEVGINLIYGILALIAAVMMFIPKKGIDDVPMDQVTFNKWLAVSLALIVGVGSGIVGAAGAFLLVPIMLVASLIASPLGAMAGKKMKTKILQGILAVLITATAVKIWTDIL
ncbi:sulfite exporter TauE/SafE family protein [Halalkalibacter flavus]|uniref:sulfite exporter TauE/SafE family protein n=1 Tax=Halalkalibacter flavus TaxID=3090668 RepID=UPI002FC9BEE5